jgi:hypothetical protein
MNRALHAFLGPEDMHSGVRTNETLDPPFGTNMYPNNTVTSLYKRKVVGVAIMISSISTPKRFLRIQ